jgi:putative transposase
VTLTESDLSELLAALKSGEFDERIRTSLEWVFQQLIEAEANVTIGAGRYERSEGRTTQRNGLRPRLLSTPAGDLELGIPKLREGSFFPSLLERRRRIDRALYAVVMEAYVHGVSTRKVDDLVKALGAASGISKSEVSRICAALDKELEEFRNRPLDHVAFPYVFADATYVKGRVRGRVVSRAVVVATGVTATGDREVLGIEVGDSEDKAFWVAFLKGLRARGLGGVQLVISDHHLGLKEAIASVFLGASWQRCRVHFMRNVLSKVPKASAEMVAAAIRTIFAQPDAEHVTRQLEEVTRMLSGQFPDVAAMLGDAAPDLLAFTAFPEALAQGLVDQPPRAPERRDQATHQRGRHLPQRRGGGPPRDRRRRRVPRRVGRGRAPLPIGRVHGEDRVEQRPAGGRQEPQGARRHSVTH